MIQDIKNGNRRTVKLLCELLFSQEPVFGDDSQKHLKSNDSRKDSQVMYKNSKLLPDLAAELRGKMADHISE